MRRGVENAEDAVGIESNMEARGRWYSLRRLKSLKCAVGVYVGESRDTEPSGWGPIDRLAGTMASREHEFHPRLTTKRARH